MAHIIVLGEVTASVRSCSMICLLTAALAHPCFAQTAPAPVPPQNPSMQSLQEGIQPALPGSASPAVGSPSSAAATAVTPSLGPARPNSLQPAGRGLPGMPGGPPLNRASGAQDPSPTYMRPPAIGPLFCDPLVDGVCD
jgi:hypothetical protein